MNKCKHCGVFVASEKAFCPNCGEPMEEEEASDRSNPSNANMMSTMIASPEEYRRLLQSVKGAYFARK